MSYESSFPKLTSRHKRILSIFVYILLRQFNIKYQECSDLLSRLKLISIKYCHEWALTIIDENVPSIILRDFRGNYKRISFYETYPELGAEAKRMR
jgi:hypothetical protein